MQVCSVWQCLMPLGRCTDAALFPTSARMLCCLLHRHAESSSKLHCLAGVYAVMVRLPCAAVDQLQQLSDKVCVAWSLWEAPLAVVWHCRAATVHGAAGNMPAVIALRP